jgi:hypothetical protein
VPRVPGRESTQKTVKLEVAVCHSFLMPTEELSPWNEKRVCAIKSCEHRIGACYTSGETRGSAAYVGYEDRLDVVVGIACSCCVDKIMDRN